MHWTPLLSVAALLARSVNAASATLRFSCSQLVVDRLDPLINPGVIGSPHLHQIVGGNAFNVTMNSDLVSTSTCTTCTATEDFSNYWTAVLFFKARNGTYHRVKTLGNPLGYSSATGGMTVYYLSSGKVTAFKPGFRMTVGDPTFRTKEQLSKYSSLVYTCLQTSTTRSGSTTNFPKGQCKVGIMVSIRFPTCWDGVNLDSPDHQSHTAYPAGNPSGNPSSGNKCPSTHPVSIPQVFFETIWDTSPFNDKGMWPEDGSQPFVWSMGDTTGYASHGDYVFGWKGDALQRAMDAGCSSDLLGNDIKCPTLKSQSLAAGNKCARPVLMREDVDSWLPAMPGNVVVHD